MSYFHVDAISAQLRAVAQPRRRSMQPRGSDTQRGRMRVVLEGAELGFRKDLDAPSPVRTCTSALHLAQAVVFKIAFSLFFA